MLWILLVARARWLTTQRPSTAAQVYVQTVLNFHPCAYDAYGMTIVEAASRGAPSVVAAGGAVGATDLLSADRGEAFLLDFSAPTERLAEQALPLPPVWRAAQTAYGRPVVLGFCGLRRTAMQARTWATAAMEAATHSPVVPLDKCSFGLGGPWGRYSCQSKFMPTAVQHAGDRAPAGP